MVKVTRGIVHAKKKDYKEGEIIKNLSDDDEKRLIDLKVAEQVKEIIVDDNSDNEGSK